MTNFYYSEKALYQRSNTPENRLESNLISFTDKKFHTILDSLYIEPFFDFVNLSGKVNEEISHYVGGIDKSHYPFPILIQVNKIQNQFFQLMDYAENTAATFYDGIEDLDTFLELSPQGPAFWRRSVWDNQLKNIAHDLYPASYCKWMETTVYAHPENQENISKIMNALSSSELPKNVITIDFRS